MVNIIFDFDDMLANGMVKHADDNMLRKTEHEKHAVILEFEGIQRGKFPVDSKKDVEESIYAIEHNEKIPEDVVKSAKYFVKQAAAKFDIDVPWDSKEEQPHIIDYKQIEKEATDKQFLLKMGNSSFDLNKDAEELREAQRYFLTTNQRMKGTDMINTARLLVKKAGTSGFVPNEEVKAYALCKYGHMAKSEFEFRKSHSNNEKYVETIEKLSQVYKNMKPNQFLNLIKEADSVINLHTKKYGRSYANFFRNPSPSRTLDVDKLKKLARAGGNEKLASVLK